MGKALVLLSGGQDSTTCLYWARERFPYIEAISFDYGQSHKIELEKAKKIATKTKVDSYHTVHIPPGVLVGSSLVSDDIKHTDKSKINESLPASFTPGRNLLFVTMAASYGVSRGIKNIVLGVCQTDYSGYPDCRRSTIDALEVCLSLGMGVGDISIHTPLMYLTKAETWKMAKDLGCFETVVEDTLTGYDGDMTKNEWGYGNINNPATKLRVDGYYEAKEKGWI